MPKDKAGFKHVQLRGTGKAHLLSKLNGIVISEFYITSVPWSQKNPEPLFQAQA